MIDRGALQWGADGARGVVVLCRPRKRNALGREVLQGLAEAAAWFDGRPEVRVIVLQGEGPSFCGGADIEDFAALLSGGDLHESGRQIAAVGRAAIDAIRGLSAVTVASVHGHAIGGGLLLMAACDLRVAADDLVMSLPEVDLGIPLTWGGLALLQAEVGVGRTRDLVMTGRRWTAEEAHAAGFVHRCVPADDRQRVTEALVQGLLEKPALPLSMTKTQLRGPVDEGELLGRALADPGFMTAATAYLMKARR